MSATTLGRKLSLSRAEIRRAAAVSSVLAALIGAIGSAQAQTVGAPCTAPDGSPGTFQQSTNPFTGQTTIVCSANGGGPPGRPVKFVQEPFMPRIDPFADRYDSLGLNPFEFVRRSLSGGFYSPSGLGGPIQFNLYGSDSASGAYAGFDASRTRNSGDRVTDAAGAVAPNSLAAGFHALDVGGGAKITADGAQLFDLNANQRLLFDLSFDYHHSSMDFGTSALTPGVASAGSVKRDIFTVAGGVDYMIDTWYFRGLAALHWSDADIVNNTTTAGAQGRTDGQGFSLSAKIGNIIPLFNSTGVNPAIIVKAPPRSVGGYAMFLDVNGRVAYVNQHDDGFTDSTGFIYGTERFSYADVGGQANLVAAVPDGRFVWMPYIGVTVDQLISFSHTFDIPAQAATAANTFNFDQSKTFWGVQGGFGLLDRGGIKTEMKIYYQHSSDTSTVGGKVVLKIPFFGAPAAEAKDSGIRVAGSK